ncbi:MAG: ComEC/Rec2 family competence protein [Lentisphaeraceae bacterium]|nr:ComEC/Rec2 family competence protein [Lentisphaeraceae bacterium]
MHFPDKILQWNVKQSHFIIKTEKIFLDNRWQDFKTKVRLSQIDEKYKFGYRIEIEGSFRAAPTPELNKILSYETHLKSNGIAYFVRADKTTNLNQVSFYNSICRQIYSWRNHIIAKATKHISSDKNKRLLTSIFFGYKGILEPQERDIYQKSGTAHLFAVSGLHVGIAALFFFSFIRLIPINKPSQTYILLSLVWIYVFMTGCPPSAIRAFVMLSVWNIARAYHLPSTGLNNLALSATILLVINPLNIVSAGFIYTFTITTSLVLVYEKSLFFFMTLNEKSKWQGSSPPTLSFCHKFIMLFLCSLTASLSSWGLNILLNQTVSPLAFVINIFTSSIALLIFYLAALSLTGFEFIYTIQETLISLLDKLCSTGAIFWKTHDINPLLIILSYLLFFAILIMKKPNRKVISLFAIAFVYISYPRNDNYIKIYSPTGSNIPSLVINIEDKKYGINCNSYEMVKDEINQDFDLLIFSQAKSAQTRYLASLLDSCEVQKVYFPENKNHYFKKKLLATHGEYQSKKASNQNIVFSRSENEESIMFNEKLPGGENLQIQIDSQKYASTTIRIRYQGKVHIYEHEYQNEDSSTIVPL